MTARRRARRRRRALVVACALGISLSLSACGSSSSSKAASDIGAADDTAVAASAAGASSSGQGSSNAGSIDVCALLTPADANTVARAQGLSGAQTDATTYSLTTQKLVENGIPPESACKFSIEENIAGGGAEAFVEIDVESADQLDKTGAKVSGLGDEAYNDMGQTQVRVGNLMLTTGENSATDDFAVALFRVMIPNLRKAE